MTLIRILRQMAWFIAKYLLTTAVLAGIFYIYAHYIEPRWIEVRERPIDITQLPPAFEGLRIVQISDLHGKLFPDKELVTRVRKLNPDLVVVTGDLFDRSEETPLEYADTVIGGITARYGVFFVYGNNDLYRGEKAVKEKLASLNIKTLINERMSLSLKGQNIDLVGVDDPNSHRDNLDQALKGAGPERKILFAHSPEIVNKAAKAGIDLVLVGHTHGRQINLPYINRVITNVRKGYERYISGLYKVGDTQMYVNRGLGENDIFLRVNARPEITVITLHRTGA